jgi:transcriptional regulator with GAF, ATPase, and Fis domain
MTETEAAAAELTSPGDLALAERLAELARALHEQPDVDDTLTAIVAAAVTTVRDAEHASISAVRRRREVHTIAATGSLAREVDRLQYETQQGPCLDSLYDAATVRLPRLAEEERWPDFVAAAAELGVGSMLAVQLYVAGDDLGALNLFSTRVDAFDEEDEHVAVLFATHASVAMADAQATERLERAVSTRDLIGQAKGILMERFRITDHQAFLLLVRASMAVNAKLTVIAEELVRSGQLPVVKQASTQDRPVS